MDCSYSCVSLNDEIFVNNQFKRFVISVTFIEYSIFTINSKKKIFYFFVHHHFWLIQFIPSYHTLVVSTGPKEIPKPFFFRLVNFLPQSGGTVLQTIEFTLAFPISGFNVTDRNRRTLNHFRKSIQFTHQNKCCSKMNLNKTVRSESCWIYVEYFIYVIYILQFVNVNWC